MSGGGMESEGAKTAPWAERLFAVKLLEDWEKLFDTEASLADTGSFAAKEAVRSLRLDWYWHIREGWTLERLIEEDGKSLHEVIDFFFSLLRERMVRYRASAEKVSGE